LGRVYGAGVLRRGGARHPDDSLHVSSRTTSGRAGSAVPSPDEPIFHQPWWLDAVAPGSWDAVTVEREGRTLARLPFVARGPRRLRVLTQPPLTPFLGPWIVPEPGTKYAKALGDQMELQGALEAKLPAASAFHQNFASTVSGCLPFIWAGYRAEVRYTYRLEDLTSEPALWEGLASNLRGHIRKAGRRLEIRDDLGIDQFYAVWSKTFERQGLPAPDRARLERVEAACAARNARDVLFARDDGGRVHAVAYVVRDRRTAYYIMSGGDPQLRTSGAGSLVLWEAIRRSRPVCEVFDFEGSMLRPVELFFRGFGGRQSPYLRVSRSTRAAGAALALREIAQSALRGSAQRWAHRLRGRRKSDAVSDPVPAPACG
jgi:hypothetical protein